MEKATLSCINLIGMCFRAIWLIMSRSNKCALELFLLKVVAVFVFGACGLFAGEPDVATLTSPANGATNVASSCTFQWTGVAAAQAYYLWVGTTPGTEDVVNSRGLPASSTSYTAKSLPFGQTLYATIWTELAGHWYSNSSTFTTAPQIATLLYPADGATNVDPDCVFQWTSVAGAQAYYLWVGTSAGAKDVVNTGSLPNTSNSWPGIDIPLGQTLYVTIWTELEGAGGRAAVPLPPTLWCRLLPPHRTGHLPWFSLPMER